MIQSMVYVAKAMSKEWLILTGVGVEKSFPEGSNIESGLRGSIKQREGKEPWRLGLVISTEMQSQEKSKACLGSKIVHYG